MTSQIKIKLSCSFSRQQLFTFIGSLVWLWLFLLIQLHCQPVPAAGPALYRTLSVSPSQGRASHRSLQPQTILATSQYINMDKQVAIDLIAVLSRSSDKALIHKVLLKVRSDLVGRNSSGIDLFHRLNGIPPLVRLISKPYEKILDVALSILANCCVNKMCCKQVTSNTETILN